MVLQWKKDELFCFGENKGEKLYLVVMRMENQVKFGFLGVEMTRP